MSGYSLGQFSRLRTDLGCEPSPPEETAAAGEARLLGRYRLLRRIGQGGAATVWLAEDPNLRRPVALKILREDPVGGAVLRRFQREATAAARLRHGSIVVVHEAGAVADPDGNLTHFIAMEHIDGVALNEATPPMPERLRVMEAVARAVHFAHEHGIIHRDLKPANVLLDAQGRPHVSDFGLARFIDGNSVQTVEGAILGTPAYMAPEQVRANPSEIDRRTDVYALGVMLYEQLCGRLPFEAPQVMELFSQILGGEPPPPRGHVPPDLRIVCLKAMQRDPRDRYATAMEFAEDLRRHLAGEPIVARPPTLLERTGRWARRHRWPVVAAAAVLIVAAAFLTRERGFAMTKQSIEAIARADAAIAAYEIEVRDPPHDMRPAYRRLDEEAVAGLRRALELQPEAAPLWAKLADVLHQLGRLDEAHAAIQRAVDLDPSADHQYRRAGILWDLYEASHDLLKTASDAGERRRIQDRLRELQSASRKAYRLAGDHPVARAVGLPADAAIASYRTAVEEGIDPVRALRLWAALERERGNHDEAIARATEAVERRRSDLFGYEFRTHMVMAHANALFDRREDPTAHYERVIREDCDVGLIVDPDSVEMLKHRGLARMDAGVAMENLFKEDPADFYRRAIEEDFDVILRLRPDDVESRLARGLVRFNWANALVQAGQDEGGLLQAAIDEDFTPAIERSPGLPQAWADRARARMVLAESAGFSEALARQAEADYSEAIRLEPTLEPAWFGRGILRAGWARNLKRQRAPYFDKQQAAIEDMKRSLALLPANVRGWVAVGICQTELGEAGIEGQFEEGMRSFGRAIELNARYSDAYEQRAIALFRARRYAEAVADLDRAMEFSTAERRRAAIESLREYARRLAAEEEF